jgi:hypothetical protein
MQGIRRPGRRLTVPYRLSWPPTWEEWLEAQDRGRTEIPPDDLSKIYEKKYGAPGADQREKGMKND